MYMPSWVNLANLLTFARLVLVPFVLMSIVEGSHLRALALFFAAALPDVLDGALARGPSGVFLALGAAEIVPWWFVGLVLGRDMLILVGAIAFLSLTKVRQFPPSRW